MKITVCRKAHFNSAHKLANQNWSKEKNLKVFGKCSYENYHGHNYELVVKVTGDIDIETGMVMDLSVLKKIIKEEVEDVLDHKNLNLDIPYFKNLIPSTENLAIFLIFGCMSIYLFYAAMMTSGQNQARLAAFLCVPFFIFFVISWIMGLNLTGVPVAAMPEAILPFVLWAMPGISGIMNWNLSD